MSDGGRRDRPLVNDDGTLSRAGQTPRRPAARPVQSSSKMRSIMGSSEEERTNGGAYGSAYGPAYGSRNSAYGSGAHGTVGKGSYVSGAYGSGSAYSNARTAPRPAPVKVTPKAPAQDRGATLRTRPQPTQTARQAGRYGYGYAGQYGQAARYGQSGQYSQASQYAQSPQTRMSPQTPQNIQPRQNQQYGQSRPVSTGTGRGGIMPPQRVSAAPRKNTAPTANPIRSSGTQNAASPIQRAPGGAQRAIGTASAATVGSAQQKKGTAARGREKKQNKGSGGWVIPEGSPIYTAQGRTYETSRDYTAARSSPPQNAKRPKKKAKEKKNAGAAILFGVKNFMTRLLIMLIICSLCTFWWYRAQFYSANGGISDDVKYSMEAEDGSALSFTAPAASAYRHGVMYVDFSTVSQWFGMAEVGSIDSMRYVITSPDDRTSEGSGSEEYVIFTNGSADASVNGSAVIMSGACRTAGSHVWVPLSFIENYITGISVEHSSRGSVTFVRDAVPGTDKENAEGTDPEGAASVSLRLKRAAPLALPEMPESDGDTVK